MKRENTFEHLLASTARRDAARVTPPFSEALHQRLMHAIAQDAKCEADAKLGGDAELDVAPPSVWNRWGARAGAAAGAMAAAAAITLAILATAGHSPRPAPVAIAPPNGVEPGSATAPVRPPTSERPVEPSATRPAVATRTPIEIPSLQFAFSRVSQGQADLEANLTPGRWAGLDHDARVAADFVLGPLSASPRGF